MTIFYGGSRAALRQIALIGIAVLAVRCQASPTGKVEVDSDFTYQGEYQGKIESAGSPLGVQVVANGGGRFTAAFLNGGLPGAGWDTTSRIEQIGTLLTDGAHFQPTDASKHYTASISLDGATLSGKTPKGELFTLNKIIRKSPTLDNAPPPNAIVIFDGKDLAAFLTGTAVLDSGLLLPYGSAASDAVTTRAFGSFTLHMEFLVPFMPNNTEQSRGNSGLYLQGRYELQILDSFGLNLLRNGEGPATQECGAFFQLVRPRLNMSFPPLSWQTYDVEFTKAKFAADGSTRLESALVTVRHNGILIHDQQKLINNTLLGDAVSPANGPLRFQSHGAAVKFRNIWIVESDGTNGLPAPRRKPAGKRQGAVLGEGLSKPALVSGRRTGKALAWGRYFSAEPPKIKIMR